jgi:predicted O-linked N-acetylglucosamine transferase (SPINDLY family)
MPTEAADHYMKALQNNPGHVQALNEMANLFVRNSRFEEALNYFECALKLSPDDVNVLCNLGSLYIGMGWPEKAEDMFRHGLEVDPHFAPLHQNMLLGLVYAPHRTPQQFYEDSRAFGRDIADPLRRTRMRAVDKAPERRLRIGYVSGDFRKHSVNYFAESLIANHDHEQYELFAYFNMMKGDDVTERMRGYFDHWRDIYRMGDDEVADLIEADGIDILVDLSGHTDGNRLKVFARKPAPVQVTWLGFPATTGMKAMDYRITDKYAEPPGVSDNLNVEKLWRLPHIFYCYGGGQKEVEVIDHPPFEDNGYITFGCFNNFAKVTDEVLQTWSRIMQRVPDSRLLLEIAGIDGPAVQDVVKGRLVRAGLPGDRIILKLRKSENQFVLYNRIDIALDPFPCNGGTTSMDTLWMGVPFITLAGQHFVSRMGVTILTNAGLPQLIADSPDDYIAKAVALAQDRDGLKALRHGLRERFIASPVMDGPLFTKDMEDAYRGMWREYCQSSETE